MENQGIKIPKKANPTGKPWLKLGFSKPGLGSLGTKCLPGVLPKLVNAKNKN